MPAYDDSKSISIYDSLKSSAQKIIEENRDASINKTATRVWLHPENLTLDEIIDALGIKDDSFQKTFIPFIWGHPKYSKLLQSVFNSDNEFVVSRVFQSFIAYHQNKLNPKKASQLFPKNFEFENLFEKTAFRKLFSKTKKQAVNRNFFEFAIEHVPAFATEALKRKKSFQHIFDGLKINISEEGAKEYVSWAKSPFRAIERFFASIFETKSLSLSIDSEFVEKIEVHKNQENVTTAIQENNQENNQVNQNPAANTESNSALQVLARTSRADYYGRPESPEKNKERKPEKGSQVVNLHQQNSASKKLNLEVASNERSGSAVVVKNDEDVASNDLSDSTVVAEQDVSSPTGQKTQAKKPSIQEQSDSNNSSIDLDSCASPSGQKTQGTHPVLNFGSPLNTQTGQSAVEEDEVNNLYSPTGKKY